MRELNKDYTISQKFAGDMTVDTAYDTAKASGMNMIDFFLNQEMSNSNAIGNLLKNKGGLVKTGDEYASPNQFAVSGYELFDLTPNLPLSQFFHQGIVPVRVGGGFAETVSAMRLTYAMAQKRLAGGNTNEANVTDVLSSKITVPAYTFQFGIVQGTVDLLKSASVAYDVLGYKLEAMRLSYQRELDYFAFLGNEGINGITPLSPDFAGGLLNATGIGSEVTLSDWADWGVEEFITNFVRIITHLVVLNRWAVDIIPDTVLFPPELWERFSQPAVVGTVGQANGTGVVTSIFDYIKSQLRERTRRDFNFIELPYISAKADENYTTAGIVAKGEENGGQIIFYRNSERVFRMPITMPLIGGALQPSPTEFGYRQNFLAVVGTPMFIFPTAFYKLHNKEKEFAITYNLDGGDNNVGNPAKFVGSDLPVVLQPATKNAKVFGGWFTDAQKTIAITELTERKAYTLYAKFTD